MLGRCRLCDNIGEYDEWLKHFLCVQHREELIVPEREEARSVLLFSGGMDSLIAYFYVTSYYEEPIDACLFVDVGQRYRDMEIEACLKVKSLKEDFPLRIRKGPDLSISEAPDAYIPLRNLYLICEAVTCFSGVKKIYIACQRGENYVSDRSLTFTELTSVLLEKLEGVRVVNPLIYVTKIDMVEWYVENSFPIDLLYATVGCYNPINGKHCGQCSACFRRSVAFEYCGLPLDPMEHDIRKWEGIQKYINDIREKRMEKRRETQTLTVLKKWGYTI